MPKYKYTLVARYAYSYYYPIHDATDGKMERKREKGRENRYENPSRDGFAINACRRRRTRRRVDNAHCVYIIICK